jgi:uncharacterized protein (TIGR03437 family)
MCKFRNVIYAAAVSLSISVGAGAASKMKVATFSPQPLGFEPNRGQAASEVEYFSRGKSSTLFLTATKAVLSLRAKDQMPVMLEMKLKGSSHTSRIEGTGQLPGVLNYYGGSDPAKWQIGVPRYARVSYHDIYPGVDLVYYGNQGQLEFDFVVSPGADPRSICMEFSGQESARIDRDGNLVLKAAGREATEQKPSVYQERNGRREPLDGRFALKGGTVTFEVARYDPSRPLVIDPVLKYSTYLGGTDQDNASGIALDSAGNTYVAGWTYSVDFAGIQFGDGSQMAYISEISPDGTKLVYTTFIYGDGDTTGLGLALDSSANAYLAGWTDSDNLPISPGAIGATNGGTAFVAKLTPGGGTISYLGRIPGNAETPTAIAVDPAGNAYVTGTSVGQLVTTSGAFETQYSGSGEYTGFVTKVAPDGKSLVYSTYFNGNDGDTINALAAGADGSAYLAGYTDSTNLPTTLGAPQASFPTAQGGYEASFVFRLNAAGSNVLFGTYLGGDIYTDVYGIALDSAGGIYVAGNTGGVQFPTTMGSYNPICEVCGDNAFVTKYNAQGQVAYSTYIADVDDTQGVGVDAFGNVYVISSVSPGSDFPVTPNADKLTTTGDGEDVAIAELDPTGSTLLYGSFYGGSSDETPSAIAVDGAGDFAITGNTDSIDLQVTPGAIETTAPKPDTGLTSTFIVKFVVPPAGPQFTAQGIVNAASFQAGPNGGAVAPGELITIFGTGIGPSQLTNGYDPVNNVFTKSVAQTQVTFDGVPAPIIYAAAGQTAAITPYSLTGKSSTQVVISYQGVQSAPVTIPVVKYVPGIFTSLASGSGQAAAENHDYTINSSSNPEQRGSFVQVFMTVGGENGVDGTLAAAAVYDTPQPTATIGGENAQVIYAGPSPGLVWGLTQVDVYIPSDLSPQNETVPLIITYGGVASQANVTLSIH